MSAIDDFIAYLSAEINRHERDGVPPAHTANMRQDLARALRFKAMELPKSVIINAAPGRDSSLSQIPFDIPPRLPLR
jgi:hypothetical protein